MPARDPAASPGHPTLSPNISITNYHGPGSPSSSGYSFASLVSPTNTTSTPNVPIEQTPSTRVPTNGYGTMGSSRSGGRRKLSLTTERQMPPAGNNSLGMGQPAGTASVANGGRRDSMPRRKPSLDWAEDL